MFKNMLNKTHTKSVKYGIIVFLALIALELIAYFGFLINLPNFYHKYALWILYLDISIATLGMSIYYMMTHRSKAPCMTGMMIGMTVGMQVGMMIGAVVGATNGYFTGAMTGMVLGSIGGTLAGFTSKSTMSWLQGLMSGIMGGTMGPMISVMMYTDHLVVFMPFYILLNVILLIGFMKMYYEEMVDDNRELVHRNIDMLTFMSACIIATFILVIIMVYGPKSGLFAL